MKILHLNSDKGIHPERSKGAAVHLCAMREAFGGLGHEVLAVDQHDPGLARQAMEAAGEVELLYERLALSAYSGSEFASSRGVPHVLEINSPLDEEESRYRSDSGQAPSQEQLSSMLKAADLLLCVSQDCASWARSKGASDTRILVAPNGVDAARFHPQRRQEAALDEFVPREDFVIGFHGRLRPWHAFERLVAAVSRLLARGYRVHLVMIGNGKFEAALAGRIERSQWTHIPWVEHEAVGAYVARFDALPLSYDPDMPCYFSPLKLLEGMAAGAVAVVPNLGDLASSVSHESTGLVYDARDPEALTEALARLYNDTDLREQLSLAGRRSAESNSWKAIAESVLHRIRRPVR